jgi:hypothetical protein
VLATAQSAIGTQLYFWATEQKQESTIPFLDFLQPSQQIWATFGILFVVQTTMRHGDKVIIAGLSKLREQTDAEWVHQALRSGETWPDLYLSYLETWGASGRNPRILADVYGCN